ncbi:MAG: inositol monophosphatase [Clostridia bacterium]|nr:inositol monophosphatase [Clostridia bacterium]
MNLTEIILPIIREAAKIMLSAHSPESSGSVVTKAGDANFVTVYDKATEDFLIKEISAKLPEAKFVAEEKENDYSVFDEDLVFIIDPIDGTTNFIRKFSHSSISVGVISHGAPVFGAVYNPYLDEMFHAEKGKGAYLNGARIFTSGRGMTDALFSFGSSPYYKKELSKKSFDLAHKLFLECADLRRLASAALDLCYVAMGRIDMFFEYRLAPWDFAAGMLILTEAGGRVTDMKGNPLKFDKPTSVIASNNACYYRLLSLANGK